MKNLLFRILPYIGLILFAAYYSQNLFIQDYITYGEEQGFINYDYVNYRHQGIWDPTHNFGSVSSYVFNRFTVGPIWAIGNKLAVSPVMIEKFYFFIIIAVTLIFSYLLFKKLSKSTHIAILTSLLYVTVYNYFVGILTSPKFVHFLILPASVFLWKQYEETKQARYVFLNVLLLICTMVISINPPQMLGAYCFVLIYILLFSHKTALLPKLTFLFSYLSIVLYVLISNFIVITNNRDLFKGDIFALPWSATDAQLFDIYRLFGGWWDYAGFRGITYNHLVDYYHSPFGVFMTYLPFLLILLALIFSKVQINMKSKVIGILIIFLFLTKGDHAPVGHFFTLIFQIPILRIFREPWAKFMPDLIFAFFLSIVLLQSGITGRNRVVGYVILYAVLCFQLFPLINGEALDHRIVDWKIADVQIPSNWLDLKDWTIQNAKNKRILVLPYVPQDEVRPIHKWTPLHYFGNPSEFLMYSHVLSGIPTDKVDEAFMPVYFAELNPQLLAASSIDYVLNMNDVETSGIKKVTIESVLPALDTANKIEFGDLDLYPVKENYLSSPIRSVSKIQYTDQICPLEDLANSKSPSNSVLLMNTSNSVEANLKSARVDYTMIDNAEYQINIQNEKQADVGLLFSQRYNSGWKIYDSTSLFARPILDDSHHKVANCFVNFWRLSSDFLAHHRTLYLRYQPQQQFALLSYLFVTTLLVNVIFASLYQFKQTNQYI